jgi:L-ascorbate metabolism protein UlaG (beta-lactamase superfamily)
MALFLRSGFLTLIVAFLASCAHEQPPSNWEPVDNRTVRVDWFGFESFSLTSSHGTKIVTNPFATGTVVGEMPRDLKPEVVLMSHEKPEATNDGVFDNVPTVFRSSIGIGSNNASGFRIRGTPTYSDPEGQNRGDMNLVFSWIMDGIRFCFLGNLENPLSSSDLALIGTVDVLFMPVGVPYSLSDAERQAIIAQLRPRVIIPMGRRAAFDAWASGFPKVYRLPGNSVLLNRSTLPAEQTVLVFSR